MRFFSGNRGDKKSTASETFKKQKALGREMTAEEKFKDRIADRLQKMMEDAIMGKKKNGPRIPGAKAEKDDGQPKQLSKNAQAMLKMLAIQKLRKDSKKEKQRILKDLRALKAKKYEADLNAQYEKDQKAAAAAYEQQQAEAAAAAAASKASDEWW